ncbi:hypothetical protein BC830DRAFT_1156126 [Chytriomyces sp. MP71]|nr:hypothetical protein BC830DRAFT_1156126 [Chytriomyces sp. MP71]
MSSAQQPANPIASAAEPAAASLTSPNQALPQAPAVPTQMPQMMPMHGKTLPAKHPFFKQVGLSAKGTISSPTDQLMSPATQKIEAKRKHLMMNIKPKFLGDKLKDIPDAPQ